MNLTVKDIFKPPFVKTNGKTDGISVLMKKSPKHKSNSKKPTRLLNIVRDNLCWLFWDDDGAKTYNQIIDWIVAALNEKWIKDFGEPEEETLSNFMKLIQKGLSLEEDPLTKEEVDDLFKTMGIKNDKT